MIKMSSPKIYADDYSGKIMMSYDQEYDINDDTWSKLEQEETPTLDGGPNHTLPG